MVSTPTPGWRLPAAPASLGAQIEASFALWLRSAGPLLPFSLLYSLAGLLPMLTLGDLGARVLAVAGNIVVYAFDPTQPEPADDPAALFDAIAAWAASPLTLALGVLAVLLALYAATAALLRQQRIADGDDAGLVAAARTAITRLPAACASWALYLLAMLACTLPLIGATMLLFVFALEVGLGGLFALLTVYLLASLALSVPLVWASVAFGYAPVIATLDGAGPLAAHRASARLVRGHWARAATMMTVPLLVYLGLGSTVSSLVYTLLGAAVLGMGGIGAVLDGGWLAWAGWIAALPMALCLPLAFSGFLVSLHDLRGRNQARL